MSPLAGWKHSIGETQNFERNMTPQTITLRLMVIGKENKNILFGKQEKNCEQM